MMMTIRKTLFTLMMAATLSFAHGALAQSAFNDPGAGIGTEGATGGLVAAEPKVDGGTIERGTSNSMAVQFRNDSGGDIEFKDVKLFPSSNVTASISSDNCSADPLQPGAQCALVIEIKGLQSGAFRVEVLARHSGRSRLATGTISGTIAASDKAVVAASDVELTPNIVDFGKLDAARPIIRSVTLRNITSNEISINDLYIDAPESSGFSLKTDCKTLPAGASCIASIVWSPLTKGPTSGALIVQHTGPSGVASANLTGEFVPTETMVAKAFPEPVPGKGLLVASEEKIDFGADIQSQSSITVSLVNSGDAPLTISKMILSGSEQGLKILKEGCTEDLTLQPTEACPLTVTWTPSKSGMVIDAVKVEHTGARGVLVLPVRGTSTAVVNVDSKPIISFVETTTVKDGKSQTTVTPAAPVDTGPPVLDGYAVSSLAARNAIITGPGGSRMVRNGQTVRLAGHEWVISISPDGVGMTTGKNKVLLVFDRSLAAPATSTPSNGANTTQNSTSTPAPSSTVSSPNSTTSSGSSNSSSSGSSSSSSSNPSRSIFP